MHRLVQIAIDTFMPLLRGNAMNAGSQCLTGLDMDQQEMLHGRLRKRQIFVNILGRIIGAILIVTGAVVAVHTIIKPLPVSHFQRSQFIQPDLEYH